ncbi:sulfotransferase [Candidatus Omnitrophota bacterium]
MNSPFFIIGCGRSGNTLLRVMLNMHSQIAIPLESLFIIDYLRCSRSLSLETLKRLIVKEIEIKEWDMNVALGDIQDCNTIVDVIERLHQLYLHKEKKTIWGQKTPRFIRYGEALKDVFPPAKFIHIIRDPRAVVNSLVKSPVHRSTFYHGALRWQRDVQFGFNLKKKYPDSVLEIFYEELVVSPGIALQRICDFLNISYEENMLVYHNKNEYEFSKQFYGDSVLNVKNPIMPQRSNAWKGEMKKYQKELVESICGPLMETYGYIKECEVNKNNGLYIASLKVKRIMNFFFQIAHYMIRRFSYIKCFLRRKLVLGLLFSDIAERDY